MISQYWERDSAVTHCRLTWTADIQPGRSISDSPGLIGLPMNDNEWKVPTLVMQQQTVFWRELYGATSKNCTYWYVLCIIVGHLIEVLCIILLEQRCGLLNATMISSADERNEKHE